jgi:hypothetical protein
MNRLGFAKIKTVVKSTEKATQAHILAWLHGNGVFAWRENSGVVIMRGHQYRMGYPGIADIMGVLPGGRILAIEVKDIKGRQNDNQKLFQQKIEESGGLYILARSIGDVQERINGTT